MPTQVTIVDPEGQPLHIEQRFQDDAVDATDMVFEFFKTTAGSIEMDVDGSATAVPFELHVRDSSIVISRILIEVLDDATEDIDGFFTIAALTNGLLIEVLGHAGETLQSFGTSDAGIKRHVDLGSLGGHDLLHTEDVPATSLFIVRWSLWKSGKRLLLREGQTMRVTVRDNLEALTQLRFSAQGFKVRDRDATVRYLPG